MARTRMLGYREQQVLAYARELVAGGRNPPSYSMICDRFGISSRTHVHRIVVRLESKGFIRRMGTGRVHRIRLRATVADAATG